jgi:hypothetical protein
MRRAGFPDGVEPRLTATVVFTATDDHIRAFAKVPYARSMWDPPRPRVGTFASAGRTAKIYTNVEPAEREVEGFIRRNQGCVSFSRSRRDRRTTAGQGPDAAGVQRYALTPCKRSDTIGS